LVALDAGRRGRLRSQDRGAFLQEPLKHIGQVPFILEATALNSAYDS